MWIDKLKEWIDQGIPCALITIIEAKGSTPRKAGARLVVNQNGETSGSVGGGLVEYEAIKMAQTAMQNNLPLTHSFSLKGETDGGSGLPCGGVCGGAVTIFIEPFIRRHEIVIFGAGHIAEKIGQFCALLDLPYSVFDDRLEYLGIDRFPTALNRYQGDFSALSKTITLSQHTYCLIMTYGHEHDEICLEQLLAHTEIPYIGMVASPHKVRVLLESMSARGVNPDARLYSPVGLRLGHNRPEEIAFSIIAELMIVMKGGSSEHARIVWNNKM